MHETRPPRRLPTILNGLGILLNLPVAVAYAFVHGLRDEGFRPLTAQDHACNALWAGLSLIFVAAWFTAGSRQGKALALGCFLLLDLGPWIALLIVRQTL